MPESCDGMQAYMEVLSLHTLPSQAMLPAQFGPKQTNTLSDLRLREDRQKQVVAQQLTGAVVDDLRLERGGRVGQP